MKNIILRSFVLKSICFGLLVGCANSDYYTAPESSLTTYELTPTTTVAAVDAGATANPTVFTEDAIIEAYVTSSDEKGTFYKSISFQSIPADGAAPIGFSVPLNVTTLYAKGFTPGRKVYISLKGLYRAEVFGSLQIGALFEGGIGRISEFQWKNHLFPSATIVNENDFVRTLSLADAYNDDNQNTLVELENVQFSDSSIGRTYYDIDSGGGATNHLLVSAVGGDEQIIRFSSFCPFTGKQVPLASGKIRGVLTKYDTDFQFIVRYESDIKLTGERFDTTPALGGTAIQYLGTFSENFESYNASNRTFPKYINDAIVGSRYWETRTFGGNKYIQLSSFGGTPEDNRTLFFVPVDMSTANKLSFKTKAGFANGNVLKVYYTTDYIPGGNANNATLVDITSSITISPGSSSGYPTTFTSSGNYNIPAALTGNGFFVFEYIGSGLTGLTTTMQIDDIVVN